MKSPADEAAPPPRLLFIVNDIGYFLSHRLPIALAAQADGFDVHVAAKDEEKKAVLIGHGFSFHPIPLRRGGSNPLTEAWLLLALIRLLRRVKPDILHLITIKPGLYGGIAARLTACPRVVVAVTGLGFVFSSTDFKASALRFLVARLYRMALKHSALRVIFQNRDDEEIISSLAALTPEKICLIRGSGVNLDDYAYSPLPPSTETPIVILAARLLKSKGVLEFVEAARRLRRRHINARFVLVGMPDPENPETVSEAFVAACVDEGIVEHWGCHEDMAEVFSRSSLVVLPSDREGMPKVLLEAQACGRAVITTDVPGCRDAITPGVTGLLVPHRDVDALANAMEQLLTDWERLRVMGQAARELAENCYDVRRVVAQHLEMYRELLVARV